MLDVVTNYAASGNAWYEQWYFYLGIVLGGGTIVGATMKFIYQHDQRISKKALYDAEIDKLLPLANDVTMILESIKPNGGITQSIADVAFRTEALAHDTNREVRTLSDNMVAHFAQSEEIHKEVNGRLQKIESAVLAQDRFCRIIHPEKP